MAESGDGQAAVEVGIDPSPPETRKPRRCVQSKLPWHVPRVDASPTGEKKQAIGEPVEGANEEKPKSTPKPQRKYQPRTPRKSPVTRKEAGGPSPVNKTSIVLAAIYHQENVCLSAGKQTRPFFTSWKETKKVPEPCHWLYPNGDYLGSCPIHVCDTVEDDVPVEWRNWVFSEKSPFDLNYSYVIKEDTPSVFDGSVEPLMFDSISLERVDLGQISDRLEKTSASSVTISNVLCNGQGTKSQLFFNQEEVHVNTEISSSSGASCVGNLENEQQDDLIKERLASYYACNSYSADCSLWTNKYQPGNALEVCGNRDSIRVLNEWLKSWHERGLENKMGSKGSDRCSTEDDEESLYESECNTDGLDVDAALKTVLLITGPTGSGKSAAIYACAKDQGFEVIEINASDVRNGSLIKQKYGEAMESHGFNRWSSEDMLGPRKKNLELLSSPNMREGKHEQGLPEIRSRTCDQDTSPAKYPLTVAENRSTSHQVANKTLILFDDVDTVFDEDCGFISTILKLAETAKRPIILTSNNKNPVLPKVLNRLVLNFTNPSSAELLSHVYMICLSEKAYVSPHLLEQLIKSCLWDIRKILMHLQFWCQGKRRTDRNLQLTYRPLPCDVDAAFLVLPRVLHWEFQCALSKMVEEEISRTVAAAEEILWPMEDMRGQEINSTKMTDFSKVKNNVPSTNKCRKKRRLTKNQSLPDHIEGPSHANNLEDFSDTFDSPVIHAHSTVRRRLFPQTDDGGLPPTDTIPEAPTAIILETQEGPDDLEHRIYPVFQFITADNPSESDEPAASHIWDTFKLQDSSGVPEPSFVFTVESKMDDYPSISVCFADITKSVHGSLGVETNGLDRKNLNSSSSAPEDVVNACNGNVKSIHVTEEQGKCQNKNGKPPISTYHFMDEYNRADFSKQMGLGNSRNSVEVDLVEGAWRRLRSHREYLKPYLSTNHEEASLILKLASGLADLISETDIMFSTCNPIANDILDPSLTPSIEPDAFSWYEKQYDMRSAYAQHGLCYYTNKCALIGSNLGCRNSANLAQEMLTSSNSTMALGKLLNWDNSNQNPYVEDCLNIKGQGCGISMERKSEFLLYNAILPLVPARSSMTLKGPAFLDYLSFMTQITRLDCSQLSESTEKNCRRRSRASKHHVRSGSLALSPENVELLAQSNQFHKAVS